MLTTCSHVLEYEGRSRGSSDPERSSVGAIKIATVSTGLPGLVGSESEARIEDAPEHTRACLTLERTPA
jgi:hypothetical protein